MNGEELLRLRAEARAALSADRAETNADMLRKHENALAALRDPEIAEDIRLEALLMTRDWEDRGTVSEDHIAAWKTILAMEDEDAATSILADTEDAVLRAGIDLPETRLSRVPARRRTRSHIAP